MNRLLVLFSFTLLMIFSVFGFSGCASGESVVHQKSVMVLNQKAQTLLEAGDIQGAVSRLESAHDLIPNEPNTVNNLAVAYTQMAQYDKAVALYSELLEKPPAPDEKTGLSKDQLAIGLGTAYEQWADQLMSKSDELAEKPDKKAQALQFKEQGVATYEKALESYQRIAKPTAEVTAQIQAVQERINALKK